MEDITLALAILLGAGFAAAKIGQLFRLPSVTGYICAGLLLGPCGFNLITHEAIVGKLGHFTQIALMLIAFGIGEHLELKHLRHTAKKIVTISLSEGAGTFLVVSCGMFLASYLAGAGNPAWGPSDYLTIALLLGAVSIATAPAAILPIMRELRASGRFTTSLLQIVAVDNGLAIMLFGMTVAITSTLIGREASLFSDLAISIGEILLSLAIGAITGLLIDLVFQRLKRRGEMLTAGLALLLLCGESARLLDLSPLLAGMAAGFIIVNRDHRDVRLFRVLNAFEAPIIVLFFTLAGAHLDLASLAVAGWLGLLYFVLRSAGKYLGARSGAILVGASRPLRENMGSALVPQAGVAIGLIFLITADETLSVYSQLITPIVLAGVLLSELVGPVLVRRALERTGEALDEGSCAGEEKDVAPPPIAVSKNDGGVELVPWSWGHLKPVRDPQGVVLFGAAHGGTVAGLARMATLLAHHHGAAPMAARVVTPQEQARAGQVDQTGGGVIETARAEVEALGYALESRVVEADSVAAGLLAMAAETRARAIILGYPLKGTAQNFQAVVERVAEAAPCPVIVIRFAGVLHTERILVPVADMKDLDTVQHMVAALAAVGQHRIRLLRMMPPYATEDELLDSECRLLNWIKHQRMTPSVRSRAVATEARLATILEEERRYDLLVMAASQAQGLQRFFFGSLAAGVSQYCTKPLVMVYGPR